MKYIIAILLLIVILLTALVVSLVQRDEVPDYLIGTWVSDKQKTIEFNKYKFGPNVGLTDNALQNMFGNLSVTYRKDAITFDTKPYTITDINGESFSSEGGSETVSSENRIISSNGTQVALIFGGAFGEKISILNFSDNLMEYWVYVGDTPFYQMHVREYFSKIR